MWSSERGSGKREREGSEEEGEWRRVFIGLRGGKMGGKSGVGRERELVEGKRGEIFGHDKNNNTLTSHSPNFGSYVRFFIFPIYYMVFVYSFLVSQI